MTSHGPGWVHRAAPAVAPHECAPPARGHARQLPIGNPGDLWRCGCGRLWSLRAARRRGLLPGDHWARASLWQRLRWYGTPGAVDPPAKPTAPPAGESGVSRSPDGR